MKFDKFDTITNEYDQELSLLKDHIIEAGRYLGEGRADEAIETLYFTRTQFAKTFLSSYDPGELLQITRVMNSMYVTALRKVTGVRPKKVSVVNAPGKPGVLLQLDLYDDPHFFERYLKFTQIDIAADQNISHEGCCPTPGPQDFEG
ncbi:MAG: hypothetical protein JW754_04560 [Candidatus Aenigmarchaeota archaeon]|nr:hypothetical protein [Candidatus Aenigmarchaeota archaeon]